MYFLFFLLHLPNVDWACDHLTYIVLIFGLYLLMYVIHRSLLVLFLFSLYIHVSYTCTIISILHIDALMGFVDSVSKIQVVKVYLP